MVRISRTTSWDKQSHYLVMRWQEQKQALKNVNVTINKLTDRMIDTTSTAAIKAYEMKLEKLESQKALIAENLANKPDRSKDFDTRFRTALNFLANPWILRVFEPRKRPARSRL